MQDPTHSAAQGQSVLVDKDVVTIVSKYRNDPPLGLNWQQVMKRKSEFENIGGTIFLGKRKHLNYLGSL